MLLSLTTTGTGIPDPVGVVVVFNMHCLCWKMVKDIAWGANLADVCFAISSSLVKTKNVPGGWLNRGFKGEAIFDSLNICPRYVGIMSKDGEPLLRYGAGVISLAVIEYFKRKEVVGHGPYRIQVPGGGNQV